MRTRNVVSAVGVAALSVALLGACGGDGDDADDNNDSGDDSSAAEDGAEASPSGPYVGTGDKTAVKAMDTAMADVDKGAVLGVDLDDDGGNQMWEVSVASGAKTEYELRVSADGAKVESNNKDNELDDDIAKLGDVKLSAQDAAKRAAKDHAGDVTGVDFETDDADNKTLVWQVTLNDNGTVTEYRLDADSGKTLGSEKDD